MKRLVDEHLLSRLSDRTMADGSVAVSDALEVARSLSAQGCRPGEGRSREYLQALTTLGLVDASLARIVEPHLDAHAILRQSGHGPTIPAIGADASSTWGVYAAHAPGITVEAQHGPDGWVLSGIKPWCSLSERLSHAVITAAVPGQGQRAFAARLDPDHVSTVPTRWVSRGLTAIPSGPIDIRSLPAVPLGDPGWYVDRPGFGWGGIGVAAVWFGIALGIRGRLLNHVAARRHDRIALSQLGGADETLFAAQACLDHAAAAIDAAEGTVLLAQRVRAVVARAAESVLLTAGHVLGPGPLVADEEYARRVADLNVYLRQHHAQRDLAYLGEILVGDQECAHA